jgi:tryptophan 2,3-dioxygenase
MIEFMLGNKNEQMLAAHAHAPAVYAELERRLNAPSVYDEFLRWLATHGHDVPAECIERDWTQPYEAHPQMVQVFRRIYEQPDQSWYEYDMCEKLVDIEERFQLWRFRHMMTVRRIIGKKRGTGGSSGVGFLMQALGVMFFPELWDVRTELTPQTHA